MTRIKPRRASYEVALQAYCSGDFVSCVDSLGDARSAEASVLRARALIRLGDSSSAVDSLDAVDLENFSHEMAAEALTVKSYALHVLQRSADAANVAVEARARCFSSGLVGIEAELLLACAFGALVAGDYEAAESSAAAILSLKDDRPSWVTSTTYSYSLGYWRARACDIRGAIEMVRRNYVGQAAWLNCAFDEFDRCGVRDDYTEVGLLANYADAAITVGLDSVLRFVFERAESIEWTPSLVAYEFRVFSALAEASSNAGDQVGALRFFRRCLDCAPNSALQIRASLERARLLREIGESFSAHEEIEHALRLSRSVKWEDSEPLHQRQLILLAGQIAKIDANQAMTLLARYDGLVRSAANGIAIKDDRFRGEEFMARGAVMHANGRSDRAVALFLDALQTFTAANLHGKAAYAAAELAELTGEKRYIEIALKQSEKQPLSILARKMARYATPSPSDVMPVTKIDFSRPKLSLLS